MTKSVYGALYLRSATVEPDSVQGWNEKRHQLEKRAEQEGIQIFKVYEDWGVSGLSQPQDRPGMTAMLNDMSQGSFHVLYLTGIDRISRNSNDALAILQQLQDAGVKIRIGDQQGDLTIGPEIGNLDNQLKQS